MSYARQMLDSYRRSFNIDAGLLAATIDALNDCAQACTADVDADLGEQHVPELIKCIRLCLDCAMFAQPPQPSQAAWPSTTPRLQSRCSRRAWQRAGIAVTSASSTPRCTSTAGSAPRRAGDASWLVSSCWLP